MILVDTSVWIDHLRRGDPLVVHALQNGQVLAHPFIIGELALGSLRQRDVVLESLADLPQASLATDAEVLQFIGAYELFGAGIGYVDAHLLASVKLTPGTTLWTRDKRLLSVAQRLSLSMPNG